MLCSLVSVKLLLYFMQPMALQGGLLRLSVLMHGRRNVPAIFIAILQYAVKSGVFCDRNLKIASVDSVLIVGQQKSYFR